MSRCALWKRTWKGQLQARIASALFALGFLSFAPAVLTVEAQGSGGLQNHILGIGNCPPWNPQSIEVCKHSLEKVVSALAPRVDAGPENIHLLINEGASAAALKRKATELASNLGPEDRLLIYANLPLGQADAGQEDEKNGYVLELWAGKKPETTSGAISEGTWISAPAFAAMIHTIPAAEAILILDTNNSHAINMHLFDKNSVDHKDRPEALISSSGTGQTANYSADRTISLFAKHLAQALSETEGSLQEVMNVAASGTRQAAIPICAELKEHQGQSVEKAIDCTQVPEVHDPDALLSRTILIPLSESEISQ
ncbi:hypothetical protein ABLO27_03325 [Roseibium sp. SCPC15]|jgi:hypothetical protein|uniref:hypothetical protein n=1 Tax=Roseibium sp. SCP15 TaxID=3141376 RepID=UPI003336ADA9